MKTQLYYTKTNAHTTLHESFRTNFKYRDDKDRRYGKLHQDSAVLYSDDGKTIPNATK